MANPSTKEKITGLVKAMKEANNRLSEIDGTLVVTVAAASGGEGIWWVNDYQVGGVDISLALSGVLDKLREIRDDILWKVEEKLKDLSQEASDESSK